MLTKNRKWVRTWPAVLLPYALEPPNCPCYSGDHVLLHATAEQLVCSSRATARYVIRTTMDVWYMAGRPLDA